jgi:hypothetical protein
MININLNPVSAVSLPFLEIKKKHNYILTILHSILESKEQSKSKRCISTLRKKNTMKFIPAICYVA